jgi:integrase
VAKQKPKKHYRLLTHKGQTLALDQWAAKTGLRPATIRSRLDILGWSVARTLDTPANDRFAGGGRPRADMPRACPQAKPHASGQARARWKVNGREYTRYFGPWGSAEAKGAYLRFQQEWAAGLAETGAAGRGLTVPALADSYLTFAEGYYRKAGRLTSEITLIRPAVGLLLAVAPDKLAAEFTADDLRAVQSAGVRAGLARKTVNAYVSRVVRMFAWGAGQTGADKQSLVPPAVVGALREVKPIERGRTRAPDRPKVGSVPRPMVEAVFPHLHKNESRRAVLEAAVRLHWLTGMRSTELVRMTPADLDRSGDLWRYNVPAELDKNAHRENAEPLAYYIGPKGQEIIAPLLAGCPRTRAIFALPPSRDGRPWITLDRNSYLRFIQLACDRAGISRWNPHRLRKAKATEVDRAARAAQAAAAAEAAAAIGDKPETAKRHYIDPTDEVRQRIAREAG